MLMKMSESSKEYSCDIVRGCFGKLCDALTVNSTVLTQCAINLFSKGLIDRSIKQCAIHTDDQLVGADTLLSCLMLRIQYNPDEFDIVVGIFSQIGALKDIAQEMKDKKEQAIDGGECASHVDQMSSDAVAKQDKVSPYRKVIPAIQVLSTDAANTLNNHLHRAFQELMSIMFNAMIGLDAQPVLISKLKFLLHVFFQCKNRNHHHYPGCKSTIEKLDSCQTASEILNHFVKASLIGPLNYKLLDIFVDVSGNEEAKGSLKDYEEDYLALFECDFDSVIHLFKHPSTAPPYPAISLPDFTIRLGQKWEETSQGNYYTLKGLLEMKFKWPLDNMIILDMTKNCILIKYGVLPLFVSAVARDLTDPTIIEELKKEDIIIELSPQLKEITRRYEQVQPPSPPLLCDSTISSSDVTLFLRSHDLAITDRQKSQLISTTQHITDVDGDKSHISTVVSEDDQSLVEASDEFLKDLPEEKLIDDWYKHEEKTISSGFYDDMLNIKEDASLADKLFACQKKIKELVEKEKKAEILEKMYKNTLVESNQLKETVKQLSTDLQKSNTKEGYGIDASVQTHSDDDNIELSYTGVLCYSRCGDGQTINQWIVRFMAARDFNALKSYLEKNFPNTVPDQTIKFGFHGNNGVLELVMSHDPATPVNGWMIQPHMNPLTILQRDMDRFGRDDGIPSPPSCLISVSNRNPKDTTPDLHYRVPVKGVVSNTKEIFIHRILEAAPSDPPKSPRSVLRNHFAKICDLVTNTTKLGNDLYKANLIPDEILDNVETNVSLTRYQQVDEYMNAIRKTMKVINNPGTIVSLCDVLEKQNNESLNEVVQSMRIELGMITDDIS